MHIVKLKIKDSVYEKLMLFLSKFNEDELQMINEDVSFSNDQKYLNAELEDILSHRAKFIAIEEAEKQLDDLIKSNEDCS